MLVNENTRLAFLILSLFYVARIVVELMSCN